MQKLFFLLTSLLILSCNGNNKLDLSKTYEGKMTYITERISEHINRRDTTVFENFLLVLDEGEFRRYTSGNKGCKGDFTLTDKVFTAKTEGCACWCDCNPLVDCIGDFIIGTFEVIEFSEDKLILESFFENDIGGVFGTYSVQKLIVLEQQ